MWITEASLRNRTTVFFLMGGLVLLGLLAYANLPRESNPDIKIPMVLVVTAYPGASPLDVERQVTQRIEREIQGVAGLESLRSLSLEGASSITAEFASGSDVDAALQKVRDRVERAKPDLPADVEEPSVLEINFSNFPILQINLSGEVGPVVLKEIADDLKEDLETVSGVLTVNLVGGVEREVRVDVDPEKLRHYRLSLDDVVDAVRSENISVPGGSLEVGDQSYSVRVPGEISEPTEVGDFVIRAPGGLPVYVRDVADVRYGFKDRVSYSYLGDKESVSLTIQKRVGANVIEVVEEIRRRIDEAKVGWPENVEATVLADESEQIKMMLSDLENNILSGLVLVVAVLMFFLGPRTALFVGLAIPFSILLTLVVIQLSGLTVNVVVLFALVLSVGMLVDNAVVVIENIFRYLLQGLEPGEAASRGTSEVGAAIAISTFTTVGAFFPLIFWPGMMGQFMSYLPITVSLALLSSLVVALTANPVLCATFLAAPPSRGQGEPRELRSERLERRLLGPYRRVLLWALDHRRLVIAGTLASFALVVAVFVRFNKGMEFMSETDPQRIWIDLEAPPGTSLARTDSWMRELAAKLEGLSDLEFLAIATGSGSQNDNRRPDPSSLGRGGGGGGGADAHTGRISIELVDRGERSQSSFVTMDQARARVENTPGVEIKLDRQIEGPPTGDALALEISGRDFPTLGRLAKAIEREIADIPGIVSLDDDFDLARPEVRIQVDRTKAARLGLSTAQIALTVRTAINGTEASTFRDGDDDVDITVRLAETARREMADLQALTITSRSGEPIRLGEVARIERGAALPAITRRNQRRVVTVTGDVASPNMVGPVRAEVLRRLEARPDLLPTGYDAEFGGQNEEEEESKAFLGKAFVYGVLIVLALILGKFDSVAMPLIISTSVLMSLIGVLIGLLVTGLPFGIVMTGLGVISLAGIVVNNAIVLLDYGEQLRARGLARREAVIRTGLRRARPVLLTAITTILGLIPLSTGYDFDFRRFVFSAGGESSQYWRTMGVAVIFGLGFATFLTLVLVPVLYDLVLERRERRQGRSRQGRQEQGREEQGREQDAASGDQNHKEQPRERPPGAGSSHPGRALDPAAREGA